MKAVKFTKGWNKYNAGETAGFDDDHADGLVRAGLAVLVGSVAAASDTIVMQAMADVHRMAQREQARFAQITADHDSRAEALDRQAADLAAREAAVAAQLAALATAVPEAPAVDQTGEDDGADAPDGFEDADGLPKQGRK